MGLGSRGDRLEGTTIGLDSRAAGEIVVELFDKSEPELDDGEWKTLLFELQSHLQETFLR
jgi:hypothetical protein